MRRIGPGFPKKVRERIEDAQRAMDFHTASHGVAPIALGPPLPPKRQRGPVENKEPIAECLHFLQLHPKMAFVGRFNRGRFSIALSDGKRAYYQMNSIRGFPDIHGLLKSGRPLYCECKSKNDKPSDDQREFLELAAQHGALVIVAYSVEDCHKALLTA